MCLEIRTRIKEWEHKFLNDNGHKPSSQDIKSNKEIHQMYKDYHSSKKTNKPTQQPSTPQKPSARGQPPLPEQTPQKESEEDLIAEVFPTPQVRGKVLGLFDMELTPQKPPTPHNNRTPRTPNDQLEAETPLNKKTPDYFVRRVDLFQQMSNDTLEDSPLIRVNRKASKSKSISEIMREAESIRQLTFNENSDNEENHTLDHSALMKPALLPNPGHTETSSPSTNNVPPPPTSGTPDDDDQAVEEVPTVPKDSYKRRPKRQTKKMTMKPVTESSMVSKSKATDNFVRLKINHNKHRKPFRRR